MTAVDAGRRPFIRATATMAVGTTLSRLTGLLRLLALVYAVKAFVLADAYNLANTMPNIVVDLVLGGVVSATFVPVFVERLTDRAEDEAWDAISAVTSVTLILLGLASVAFLVASPFIIDLMTSLYHGSDGAAERQVATDLLVLFVPQLTCYGVIAVATALLNARGKFAAPMFAPIANNVVLIGVYLAFGITVHDTSVTGVEDHRARLLLLGLGTTAGVVVQVAALVPTIRRTDLRLRWLPQFRHEAVRRVIRLSGWTFGLVVTNQIALIVVLALSQRVGTGAVSAYTYAYAFFQLPYGIVAVSIMTATVPELARHWTTGDLAAFRRRLAVGLRGMLAIMVPAAAGMVVLARPLLLLLGAAIGHAGDTGETGQALSMLALGLPGFCVFIYAVRVLQSIQDLRAAFRLYVLENGVNVVLAVVLAGPLGVRGIALSISIAYTVGAVAALAVVRRRVAGLAGDLVTRPLGRVLLASTALVVGAAAGASLSGAETVGALLLRVGAGVVFGAVAFVVAAVILGWAADRRRRAGRGPSPGAPRAPRAGLDRRDAAGPDPAGPRPAGPRPAGPRPAEPRPAGPRHHDDRRIAADGAPPGPVPVVGFPLGRARPGGPRRDETAPPHHGDTAPPHHGDTAPPHHDDAGAPDDTPVVIARFVEPGAGGPSGRRRPPTAPDGPADDDAAPDDSGRARRRGRGRSGAPPPPDRLPPAGRPPRRPGPLGPTRKPGSGHPEHGRLDD